jgi:hypothetical protein
VFLLIRERLEYGIRKRAAITGSSEQRFPPVLCAMSRLMIRHESLLLISRNSLGTGSALSLLKQFKKGKLVRLLWGPVHDGILLPLMVKLTRFVAVWTFFSHLLCRITMDERMHIVMHIANFSEYGELEIFIVHRFLWCPLT